MLKMTSTCLIQRTVLFKPSISSCVRLDASKLDFLVTIIILCNLSISGHELLIVLFCYPHNVWYSVVMTSFLPIMLLTCEFFLFFGFLVDVFRGLSIVFNFAKKNQLLPWLILLALFKFHIASSNFIFIIFL